MPFRTRSLPVAIVEAIAFHHVPRRSDLHTCGPLTAVHVANVLEHELSNAPTYGPPSEIDGSYLAAIGIEDRLELWRQEAERILHGRDEA